jgi:hypothetical protein
MARGFLFRQRLIVFLFFFLTVLTCVSGCFPTTPVALSPICTPEGTAVNIYRVEPQSWANMIFEYAYPTIPTALPPNTPVPPDTPAPTIPPVPMAFNEAQIQGARYAAFQYLITETQRWSDIETIQLSDGSQVEIVITFISPGLIQAVFLSDILKDRFITSGFQSQIQNTLVHIAEREELLFLAIVTSASNNTTRHSIKIPVDTLVLNNAENLHFAPSHNDYNLEQPINPFTQAVFGYLAYPLARPSDNKCKWALDPKYDTNIVITLPFIEVDGVSGGPYSWTIPYAALINPIAPPDPPQFMPPPNYDQSQMSPSSTPPNGISQNNKWQDLARFIWWKVTLGN